MTFSHPTTEKHATRVTTGEHATPVRFAAPTERAGR
jgi:hypothetical protein